MNIQGYIWCGIVAPVLILSFQNCDRVNFTDTQLASSESLSSGNGDGYGGKLTIYHHIDLANPCRERNQSGQTLPNNSIFLYGSSKAQVVRESCQDITPRNLAANQFELRADQSLVFSGRSYLPHAPVDFETVAATCPTGFTALASPVRDNLVDYPFDLTVDPWGTLGGIDRILQGSMAGLPSFLLTRSLDATSDPALRLDQYISLQRNTMYAFSFLARRGSSNSVRLMMYNNRPVLLDLGVTWSLLNGTILDQWVTGLTDVSMISRPVGDAYFYTVYFRTPASVSGLDIGFAAGDNTLGSSIYATSAQLVNVADFCAPL